MPMYIRWKMYISLPLRPVNPAILHSFSTIAFDTETFPQHYISRTAWIRQKAVAKAQNIKKFQ